MSGILLFFGSVGGGAIASRLSRASVAQLASFSTSSDGSSTSKVKKSPIYTRTGDKGTTSVRKLILSFLFNLGYSVIQWRTST